MKNCGQEMYPPQTSVRTIKEDSSELEIARSTALSEYRKCGEEDYANIITSPFIRRRLTHHPGTNRTPAFSPDGTTVFFQSDRDGGGVYAVREFSASVC